MTRWHTARVLASSLRNRSLAHCRHARVKFSELRDKAYSVRHNRCSGRSCHRNTTRVLARQGETRVDGRASLASAAPRPRQWDGVMITTILEVLVAVVVLIVIIAVAALHFLRADDSDTFDDMPEEPRRTRRHPAEPAAQPALVPAGRGRSRQPEAVTEQWGAAGRDGRPADGRGRPTDERSRQAKPERHGGRPASGQRPAPVPAKQAAARQAQAARPAKPDSGASEWDKLSDVDYWAELASDKPLTPAAPAAAASSDSSRSPRRGADQKADARSASRGEVAQLPVRERSRSRSGPAPRPADTGITEQIDVRAARSGGRYGSEPATHGLAAPARLADQSPASPGLPNGQRPANARPVNGRPVNGRPANGRPTGGGQRPGPAPDRRALPAGPSHSGGHARPPQPLDDDPLTSPSFPAVNTSDSRSYRTRRPSSSQLPASSQPPASPQLPASPRPNGHGTGSYSDPAQPYSTYPSAPDRSSSLPNGYPVQPAAASAGSSYSGSPVANPYGSFVEAPAHSGAATPTPAPAPAPTPHFDAAAYGSGYAAGQQAVAGVNWYAAPDAGQADAGYSPSPGTGNGVSYESPTYQGGHAAPAGGSGPGYLTGQYDQRGYGAPELTYGQDGYPGYPGYGGSGR